MPVQDRTNEFRACVDSICNRYAMRGTEFKQRLLNKDRSSKSEFSRMASAIGKNINDTGFKLHKLAQRTFVDILLLLQHLVRDISSLVAKRKTLFDDRPVEISVRTTTPHSTFCA